LLRPSRCPSRFSDLWPFHRKPEIWSLLGRQPTLRFPSQVPLVAAYSDSAPYTPRSAVLWTQESGALLVNKRQAWVPLLLSVFFNFHSSFYSPLIYANNSVGIGDKDTFQLAWFALRYPFHQVEQPPDLLGHIHFRPGSNANAALREIVGDPSQHFHGVALLQHDLVGRPLFIHNNLMKFIGSRRFCDKRLPRVWQTHPFLHSLELSPWMFVQRFWPETANLALIGFVETHERVCMPQSPLVPLEEVLPNYFERVMYPVLVSVFRAEWAPALSWNT